MIIIITAIVIASMHFGRTEEFGIEETKSKNFTLIDTTNEYFNNFPKSGFKPKLNDSSRDARFDEETCAGVCICTLSSPMVLIVDCSRAGIEPDLFELLRNHKFPVPEGGEVRVVIMSSELVFLNNGIFSTLGLTQMHVKYNHGLSIISRSVFNASSSSLRVLDLRNNNLTHFPLGTLNGLENLEFLSLDDNKISLIPEWMSNVTSLIHLSLANNKIASISEGGLTKLENLRFLDLHNNELRTLPAPLSHLSNLRTLIIWGNPIISLPSG